MGDGGVVVLLMVLLVDPLAHACALAAAGVYCNTDMHG
jgi:hypothetical protein